MRPTKAADKRSKQVKDGAVDSGRKPNVEEAGRSFSA
jgi:hypothetical protein